MDIKYDLLPKQKRRKQGLNVTVDLYPIASELYENLNSIGIIQRTKEIPQLGLIKVNNNLKKNRFDYIVLQLYFHQLIKKNIQGCLRFTYNNVVRAKEFLPESSGIREDVSIADIIQCLVLSYNIGHFYNTFTSSRALIMLAEENDTFLKSFQVACGNQRFTEVLEHIVKNKDYLRMHLLNSLIILEQCDSNLDSIRLSKEIIYSYLHEKRLPYDSKLHYVFDLFRTVRNTAYVAYDLQVANTPFTLDLWNESAVIGFFEELLSVFNNGKSARQLIQSIQKILDGTVYNENSNAICYYQIARKISRSMVNEYNGEWKDYYIDYFLNKGSCFNRIYSQRRDYDQSAILKITFEESQRNIAEGLINELEHTNNVRVGYYDRYSNETTVLLSLKSTCKDKSKVAFRLLKIIIRYLRRMDITAYDDRYILTTKFFLQYFFGNRSVLIKPVIDEKKCVLCTRGKARRIEELKNIISNSKGNLDDDHEVQVILDKIKSDYKNDTCITVPGSTLVFTPEGQKLCEFDGIVIFPQRKEKQVILLEAKNTGKKPSYGAQCLAKKIKRLGWEYDKKEIIVSDYDAYYELTIGKEV